MILVIPEILLVLEYGIKIFHSTPSQQTNVANDTRHASNRECTTGEAYKHDFVAGSVIRSNKTVDFTNVLANAGPKKATGERIYHARTGPNARVVVDDLGFAVETYSFQGS